MDWSYASVHMFRLYLDLWNSCLPVGLSRHSSGGSTAGEAQALHTFQVRGHPLSHCVLAIHCVMQLWFVFGFAVARQECEA